MQRRRLYDPRMTLGEYLKRRSPTVWIPGALMVLTVWAFSLYAPNNRFQAWAATYVQPIFLLAAVAFSQSARCPRCHARLGHIDFGGRFRRAPQRALDRCLNCGLHPQEDIPTPR